MKKFLILLALYTITTHTCNAATKCVAPVINYSCDTVTNTGTYDWSTTCNTAAGRMTIRGIYTCSNQSSTSLGNTSETLTFSRSDRTENKYCWYRLLSPAVSKWVYTNVYFESNCENGCANIVSLGLWDGKYAAYLFNALSAK